MLHRDGSSLQDVAVARPVIGVVLAVVTLAAYLPVFWAGFLWDDAYWTQLLPHLNDPWGPAKYFVSTQPADYLPVTATMFWLLTRLFGTEPMGYHMVNLLLHVLGVMLLWRVIVRLGVSELAAGLSALVFAVHPINVGSVAWITEMKNTLSLVFYASSMLAFLHFDETRMRRWYMLSVLCFALGLLSKSSGVMLPAVMLLCLWWRHGKVTRKHVLLMLPLLLLAGAMAVTTIWFQRHGAINARVVRPEGFGSRLAAAGWIIWFYVKQTLWPGTLMMIYPRWDIDMSQRWIHLPGLAWVTLLAGLWRMRAAWSRAAFTALACFTLLLLPVLGFIAIYYHIYSLVADQWLYLPVIGLTTLVVAGSMTLASHSRQAHMIALAGWVVIICLLTVLTWQRTTTFQSARSLWRDNLAKNSESWMVHQSLAMLDIDDGRFDSAVWHLRQAIALKSDFEDLPNTLGVLLLKHNRTQEALDRFAQAVKLRPDFFEAQTNLGKAMMMLNQPAKSLVPFEQAVKLRPDNAEARFNLGSALLSLNQHVQAIEQLRHAVRLDPTHAGAQTNLGHVLMNTSDLAGAEQHFRLALQHQPMMAEAHLGLASVSARRGDPAGVIEHCQRAIEANELKIQAYYLLADTLVRIGQREQARAYIEQVWTRAQVRGIASLAQALQPLMQALNQPQDSSILSQ